MLIVHVCRSWVVWLALTTAFLSSAVQANVLEGVRVWPSPDETRVVIDVKSEVDFSYFTLSGPDRLVVDLKQTSLGTKLPVHVSDSAILTKIRASSPPEKSSYRLVLELKRKSSPQLFKLAPTPGGQYGHRLVIDLPHAESASQPAAKPSSETKVSRDASQLYGTADIVVAIDAGHGGEDPGSIGPTRKYEKDVTLSVAKKLADQIDAVPGMKAVLTRRGDYFVNLNKRSEIARKNKAHLLVSIHADAFHTPQPRGASVFVLNTRRANTEIARWVENHEQQSELLGGAGEVLAKNNADRNVSQTLLDLQFSHSQKEGYKVATNILREMGKVAHLHKREPVNASLAVLKSPDIPSVLVETGFISNPAEEKLLFQRSHQDKLAHALTVAVVQYFEDNPPEGTLFANRGKTQKHKVQRGESLSVIANKYGTRVEAIVQTNKLKSNNLAVGQILTIPGGSRGPVHVPVVSNPVETETVTHVVKSGDYLGKLASTYKVSVDAIKRENNLRSDTLKLGQKLKITVSLKDKPLRKHTVARGEFLGKIASKYNVSVQSIREANKLRSDNLAVGQVLIIPNK
ncbi:MULTISPECIES: N-acetylmuramoyl-L-alanine amidase [Vibrio]|uniref:N-acetylmuramoyl-L-alanine amidase n=1 Tax=Vibrio furnissii TaxID=29494 RepID=A0A0Q2UTM8_VIBFU|nr:N-acetylmuramoyl-L-alanine amidase [Vibrio furnissii]KQH83936.1 N-acetylmuramoyl-L-alanine amidase [Vibrio furnissii]MCG6213142.1 N-acetylmuramoyl-L-alanine amidase [Vibrio furnissii]MCG6232470.1 N-acetylmuramoyl-L-alanine amidase [Vibrio furnissii]MCG6257776.1 N-acetylmuramoyl-L-alanine amidase [Vibrio furnissii]MCG6268227.1 N-acetylmuramoyl-L-alanine amidase [Vibrio furnissii]